MSTGDQLIRPLDEKQFSVVISTAEQVLPIWSHELWPGRQSPIRATSSCKYLGGYDLSYHQSNVIFWAIHDNNHHIVGVNSGFKTGEKQYRSRGLWVHHSVRQRGLANLLLKAVIEFAQEQNCDSVWSLARASALPVYLKAGFFQTSESITEGMEFGPNFFVHRDLRVKHV